MRQSVAQPDRASPECAASVRQVEADLPYVHRAIVGLLQRLPPATEIGTFAQSKAGPAIL
jgi:hypothetical protein